MINKPNRPKQASQLPSKQPSQAPSGKLVLPAPSEQGPDGQTHTSATSTMSRISRMSASVSRGLNLLRSLPASRIIALAIALVLTACIALVALGANTLLHPTSSHSPQTLSTGRTTPSASAAASTPKGANALMVQITDISDSVENGKTVETEVQTSKPGVSVKLQVTYQISPFSSTSASKTTDDDGQATIDWSPNVAPFSGKIQATVTAVATDQNGQQVMSDPMTVTITNQRHGDNGNNDN